MKKVIVILFSLFFSFLGESQSGRTDSKGGHHDRSNGTYHYHHGNSAHQHPNGIRQYNSKNSTSLNDYSSNTARQSSLVVKEKNWFVRKKTLSVFIGAGLIVSAFFVSVRVRKK